MPQGDFLPVPLIATLTNGTEFTGLVALLAGLGVPLAPWFNPTLVLTFVFLVLTIVNRTRCTLAESPLHR
ncbi:MAG: hypothetical protein CK548_04135 [Opitutia bacterium]|nr:MAG: hypothetical protein CK548_04135 [Opitutae bacterium]